MAPRLPPSTLELIQGALLSGKLKQCVIAKHAPCTPHSASHINRNLLSYGCTTAPPNGGGRPRTTTDPVVETLCEYLVGKPNLLLKEMDVWLWDEFGILLAGHDNKSAVEG